MKMKLVAVLAFMSACSLAFAEPSLKSVYVVKEKAGDTTTISLENKNNVRAYVTYKISTIWREGTTDKAEGGVSLDAGEKQSMTSWERTGDILNVTYTLKEVTLSRN